MNDWTCVTYVPIGSEARLGFLPRDVNGDHTEDDGDRETLIGCLQGDRRSTEHQCDVDRSGACAPGDILPLIDLLHGADAYDVWRDASLAECDP